jgi:hypothetical protein
MLFQTTTLKLVRVFACPKGIHDGDESVAAGFEFIAVRGESAALD